MGEEKPLSTTNRKLRIATEQDKAVAKPVTNFLDLPGCEFTETQLKITADLQLEEWARIGDVLRRAESGIQWWLGDWMAYGERKYGDTKYAQAVDVHEQTGINVDTLRYYQHVSEKVSPVRRLTNLSWSHHQVICGLPDKEQSQWLTEAAKEGYSYRELKRAVEKSERAKNFKLVHAVLEKIWERIQDGCYTPESIMKCSECGKDIFGLDADEIKLYMQQLVGSGKAEWRKQGGKKEDQRGSMPELCVPAGTPAGSDFNAGYRPRVEYGEEEDHF